MGPETCKGTGGAGHLGFVCVKRAEECPYLSNIHPRSVNGEQPSLACAASLSPAGIHQGSSITGPILAASTSPQQEPTAIHSQLLIISLER